MNATEYSTPNIALTSWAWINKPDEIASHTLSEQPNFNLKSPQRSQWLMLKPIRQWLDNLEISNAEFAHFICKLIPAQCPFERDITFLGRTILHIPPMCKLNPVYEEVVGLRFRALCYLADVCGEDVTPYC